MVSRTRPQPQTIFWLIYFYALPNRRLQHLNPVASDSTACRDLQRTPTPRASQRFLDTQTESRLGASTRGPGKQDHTLAAGPAVSPSIPAFQYAITSWHGGKGVARQRHQPSGLLPSLPQLLQLLPPLLSPFRSVYSNKSSDKSYHW
jgi:hypothetical protein